MRPGCRGRWDGVGIRGDTGVRSRRGIASRDGRRRNLPKPHRFPVEAVLAHLLHGIEVVLPQTQQTDIRTQDIPVSGPVMQRHLPFHPLPHTAVLQRSTHERQTRVRGQFLIGPPISKRRKTHLPATHCRGESETSARHTETVGSMDEACSEPGTKSRTKVKYILVHETVHFLGCRHNHRFGDLMDRAMPSGAPTARNSTAPARPRRLGLLTMRRSPRNASSSARAVLCQRLLLRHAAPTALRAPVPSRLPP